MIQCQNIQAINGSLFKNSVTGEKTSNIMQAGDNFISFQE